MTTADLRAALIHALTEGKPLSLPDARNLVDAYGNARVAESQYIADNSARWTAYQRWEAAGRPTHPYAGHSKERAEKGDPGHCERCCQMGHVAAHPGLGCGDVGCTKGHDE